MLICIKLEWYSFKVQFRKYEVLYRKRNQSFHSSFLYSGSKTRKSDQSGMLSIQIHTVYSTYTVDESIQIPPLIIISTIKFL